MPSNVVPYKRYDRKSIETVLTGNEALDIAADESTISRWRSWFTKLAGYFAGCLESIDMRLDYKEKIQQLLPTSPLRRIWQHTSNAADWLVKVVRPLVKLNLWVHTRST